MYLLHYIVVLSFFQLQSLIFSYNVMCHVITKDFRKFFIYMLLTAIQFSSHGSKINLILFHYTQRKKSTTKSEQAPVMFTGCLKKSQMTEILTGQKKKTQGNCNESQNESLTS